MAELPYYVLKIFIDQNLVDNETSEKYTKTVNKQQTIIQNYKHTFHLR